MKIFISWSGKLSEQIALYLRTWLQNVIQVAQPYVSTEDMDKGSRWFAEIDRELGDCEFGIICLTRENMNKPWILFEAGAMSRSITRARVTPLLIDISPADLSGPLAQFQATTISKEDMLRLAKDISAGIPGQSGEAIVERSFQKWWPDLSKEVAEIAESIEPNRSRIDSRKDRELLEELLQISRGLNQHVSLLTSQSPPPVSKAEHSPTSGDAGTILDFIKARLDKDRKLRVLAALDQATEVYVDGALLCIDYDPRNYHLQELLARPDNVTLLRELCQQASGRAMGIRIRTKEANSEAGSDIKSESVL